MKTKKSILLYFLLTFSIYGNAQGDVYYVGHSLINLNIPFQVSNIQDSAGVTNYFKHHINIGASLKTNWQDTLWNPHPIWDPTAGANVDRGTNHFVELINPYDALILTAAVPLLNYPIDTVVIYATNFINLRKTGNPNIKKYLYATWEGDAATGTSWRNTLTNLQDDWELIAKYNIGKKLHEH